MKFKFNHNNFNVLDLEKSIAFYEEALGLKVVNEFKAPDGAFILERKKRGSNKAIMEMVSRDLPDQKFHLSFDTQKCLWQLDELEKESFKEPVNPLLEAVNQFLEREGKSWHGRASDLVDLLDIEKMSPNMLTKNLNPEVGRLSTEYGIEYENKRSNRGSDITLVKKRDKSIYSDDSDDI